MNLEQLKASDYSILSVVAGSHMYGLNLPTSDVDTRGIFNLPLNEYLKIGAPKQINDETNDEVHYEVVRFLTLAATANPNILEIMFAPEDKIIHKSPAANIILSNRDKFLTKACRNSLGGYATTQIQKARGQNKMIVNPCTERKTPIDFCYMYHGNERVSPLSEFLNVCHINQENVGLARVPNFLNAYALYNKRFAQHRCFIPEDLEIINNWIPRGIINSDLSSNELRLSSIPEAVAKVGFMGIIHYNQDGYTSHCKEYNNYQNWVANRNPVRYATNQEHGKGYDSKNLMHCVRLLNMGIELADTGILNVVRPDREFLLKIRAGEFEYDYLLNLAEEKLALLDEKFAASTLPDRVPNELIDDMILEMKSDAYL